MDRMIIGIGTGRCGTQSLAALLSAQDGCEITHERYGPRVRWGASWRTYPLALWQTCMQGDAPIAGDVALYWLPQVRRFARQAESADVGLRIVCMERPRAEVVASFERKIGPKVDHWTYDSPAHAWNWCFPLEDGATRAERIGAYWDRYHAAVRGLRSDGVPVRIMPTQDLNDPEAVRGLLEWCGVEAPLVRPGIHKNATATHA